MDTDEELKALFSAVHSGEITPEEAVFLAKGQHNKNPKGRPKGPTKRVSNRAIFLIAGYLIFRPHCKNNDDAYRQIGEVFNCAAGTVKPWVERALRIDKQITVDVFVTADYSINLVIIDSEIRARYEHLMGLGLVHQVAAWLHCETAEPGYSRLLDKITGKRKMLI